MTFSNQLFFVLFLLLPLLRASHPKDCSSSSCGLQDVHARFPFWLDPNQPDFCGHPGFDLHCTISQNTALNLPKSGTFLVREIDYRSQHIRLYDPEACLARKLLTFDVSGSPFSALYLAKYTFLTCPNEVVKSSGFDSIPCLGNSTSSFLATTSLDIAKSMLPSCQIVKTLDVPVSRPVVTEKSRFSTYVNNQDLWLKWDSPSCSNCERNHLRCGFISNASLQVKCFPFEKSGHNHTGVQVLKIISLAIFGPVIIFATCIAIGVCTSDRFTSRRRRNVAIAAAQPNEVIVTAGLDESTIESYKKVELGESRRLPGVNDIVCPICLSEYASKETVRCIPECEHCFHIDCIDAWLKLHGFNLHCTDLNKTVLELPMSGTFLVHNIDYYKQQIYISDPENCLAKRLLTFNMSGSPFSSRFSSFYTFFSCPNDVVLPFSYRSIPCLNNSTSSFYATSNYEFVQIMFPSCQIVKRLHVPSPFGEIEFLSYVGNQSLMLEWVSPSCRSCEMEYLRCGFRKKSSLEVKCFGSKEPGHLSSGVVAVIISFSIIGAVTLLGACIAIRVYNSPRRGHSAIAAAATVRQQPREIMAAARGLDQSTIETYKKVELGESRRLPGTNGIICPICLSEYASKETIRFMPECDHCFHVECIDVWLKIHGSCPLCRNSRK
uniref:RING-type domain-containing protein n=1 Tax=Brassica oleracea var. oleracea TaxID=109376 RepID=A0A0D3C6K1_BRAOL